MDGSLLSVTGARKTLKAAIGCVGTGLHSGDRVSLTLRPAEAGTGILGGMGQHGRDLGGSRVVDVWSWMEINRRRRSG